jgi:hypothetical protein
VLPWPDLTVFVASTASRYLPSYPGRPCRAAAKAWQKEVSSSVPRLASSLASCGCSAGRTAGRLAPHSSSPAAGPGDRIVQIEVRDRGVEVTHHPTEVWADVPTRAKHIAACAQTHTYSDRCLARLAPRIRAKTTKTTKKRFLLGAPARRERVIRVAAPASIFDHRVVAARALHWAAWRGRGMHLC